MLEDRFQTSCVHGPLGDEVMSASHECTDGGVGPHEILYGLENVSNGLFQVRVSM